MIFHGQRKSQSRAFSLEPALPFHIDKLDVIFAGFGFLDF